MNTVTINGKTITIRNGKDISVRGNKVFVDGVEYKGEENSNEKLTIIIQAKVDNLEVITDGEVLIEGNISGNVRVEGSLSCNDVEGSVSSGGSIQCDDVGGNVSAGGSVQCDDIAGNCTAGGSIKRG